MPVDPQTGLYSPNAGIYPGGGLSGVASALSNIDATGIAKQEAQKRQAALMLQQLQTQQLQQEQEGQRNLRSYMSQNPEAAWSDVGKQAIASGAVGPQQISTMSWRGGGAEAKDFQTQFNSAIGFAKIGMPIDAAFSAAGLDDKSLRDQGYDPGKIKTSAQSLIQERGAKTEELASQTGLNQAKTNQIGVLTPGLVKNQNARTMLFQAQAALARAKAATEQADLAGTGPKADALRIKAQQLAAPYVKMAGNLRHWAQNEVDPEEKTKILQQADALEAEAKQYSGGGSAVSSGGSTTLAKPDTSTQTPGLPAGAKVIDLTGK